MKVRPTTTSNLSSIPAPDFALPHCSSTIDTESADIIIPDGTQLDDVASSVFTFNKPEFINSSLALNKSFDLGEFINDSVSDEVKYQLVTNIRARNMSHDFKKDIDEKKKIKRPFQKTWLEKYSWLVYSPKLKGGLCKFCALFKAVLKRGIFGAFVIKAHQDYKHFHEDARGHEKSSWHLESTLMAESFCASVEMRKKNVIEQLDSGITELVNTNRKKLK